jgi:glycyl-tRNA synthetase beta chain
MPDLLVEIGTEEIPAGYLEPALEALAAAVRGRLVESRLEPDAVQTAGTPRRMTLAVTGIPAEQSPVVERSVGPPAAAAFDEDGKPKKAAEGFARSKGVSVEDLKVEETKRGPYVVVEIERPGETAAALLPEILRESVAAVPFPKSMHWEGEGALFARPVRSLVVLLDDQVVPFEFAGLTAGRETLGHPFLAPGPIELADASLESYREALRERCVLVDVEERREAIRAQIEEVLEAHGSELTETALLAEVTNLVEWPRAVVGRFDAHFLDVPDPVVCAAMMEHQRYFPVRDAGGNLQPEFITVSNRSAEQDDQVRAGNERVLIARLEDARFFWEHDSGKPLDELVEMLADVVFLADIGNNLQRTERLVELSCAIAAKLAGAADAGHVKRAARLCKADLLTGLVGEFPSLQGVVGREIALAQGEPAAVAHAIAEHYLPAGAEDALPQTPEGSVLALADKVDVITGCFAVGLLPSGSQDPYALRRNALGVLLIIERNGFDLSLSELVDMARGICADHGVECDAEAAAKVAEFFRDRLYHAAIDRGFRHDFVRAVLAAGCDDVRGFWARLDALAECGRHDWWPALVELVDRTYRIQRDAGEIGPVNADLLTDAEEKDLAEALEAHCDEVVGMFEAGEYVAAAEAYCAVFAERVHEFFEEVFVNVDDEAVRLNRKSLCGWVYRLFAERFADLYLIETAEAQS